MLTTIATHLEHANTTALVVYAMLGAITVGLGPFAIADLILHVAAARSVSKAAR